MVNKCADDLFLDVNMTSENDTAADDVITDHFASELSHDASIAGTALGILVIILGTFGNVLVILAVVLSKPLLKASNMFIVSLAVCDLFQTIMIRPLYLHTYILGRWSFGPRVCLYVLYASNLAILESILHVSAIAFYRYVIIVHPTVARKFQSPKAVILLIFLIYIGPMLIILMPSLPRLREEPTMHHTVSFNNHIMFCACNKFSENQDQFSGRSLSGIIKKSVFLFCTAAFLFYCYIRIFQAVRQSGHFVNSIQSVTMFSPTRIRIRKEMTLLKTVIVVFLAFVVSYLPVTVLYAVDKKMSLPDMVYVITVVLLWKSSSVNWMIYGLMNRQFQQAYRYVLCGLKYPVNGIPDNGSGCRASNTNNVPGREHQEMKRTFKSRTDSSPESACYEMD